MNVAETAVEMSSFVYVAPRAPDRWIVATDDAFAPPISEHATCAAAADAAQAHAIAAGIPEVVIHDLDGEEHSRLL